ncbi:histidine phosphatase family protein [Kineothrix sp. MSJ-39]|uniref:histidine phosphatase family protein n=1 Tax=Kineothrix sp. MSJ-39 TaxID=2841533 RepID=UPI001C11D99A|nr:histidine phosphatase family protein [Kineothrix sp. MSJ-39]MBU5430171.1 histidine phosphatase family protein [Kineothrix sp. MSJ-39]
MQLEILLLRHGQTQGNLEKRYIGKTDEPLLMEDTERIQKVSSLQKRLKQENFARPQKLFVSPMLRCRQTAELLFPGQEQVVIDKLREMDFGRFEGKNYRELSPDPAYQAWIDSGGRLPFPEGEDRACFIRRTMDGFRQMTEQAWQGNCRQLAAVVHGGSIMAIISSLLQDDYFAYQVSNLAGYAFCYEGAGKIQAVRRIEP